jgi:hypothetical protein
MSSEQMGQLHGAQRRINHAGCVHAGEVRTGPFMQIGQLH